MGLEPNVLSEKGSFGHGSRDAVNTMSRACRVGVASLDEQGEPQFVEASGWYASYNHSHLCPSLQVHGLAPMKLRRRSAQAGWAKSITHGTRDWTGRLQSRFCRDIFPMIPSASNAFSGKQKPFPASNCPPF